MLVLPWLPHLPGQALNPTQLLGSTHLGNIFAVPAQFPSRLRPL